MYENNYKLYIINYKSDAMDWKTIVNCNIDQEPQTIHIGSKNNLYSAWSSFVHCGQTP
jgi:hypothetical protein